jgi:hypothetical protein
MAQHARHQPRAGHDGEAQLLKKREGVELEPVLHDAAVGEAVELESRERHLLVSWRKSLELARVGALEMDPLGDEVTFADGVLDPDPKIGEALDEAGEELHPRVRIQRSRLQARRGVGDVVRPANVGLAGVVALVEDLDPAARGSLVVFY